ncbi:hypothetical protein L841_1761 [Mycobacterium sp. MAC_080597_8934]|nr:hypothetical protein L839_5390 [Mycobacterium avium MAV_120809_2495]ETZ64158.1 hypothetical protein L840_2025 [Mycobacterium sp. MAC_011194_8550]ETZ68639.1 hypothetical protein L841_1761 [Mycobacterium sp. MAC_080597_8934]
MASAKLSIAAAGPAELANPPRHTVSLIYLLSIEQTRYCLGLADQPTLGG